MAKIKGIELLRHFVAKSPAGQTYRLQHLREIVGYPSVVTSTDPLAP